MPTLNRLIESDGVTYTPGTPLSELPPRIRDSVVSVGWVSAHDLPSPAAPRGKPAGDDPPSAAADPVPEPAPAQEPKPKARRSRAKPAT